MDFNKAGYLFWGKNNGCGFIGSTCNGFKEFCSNPDTLSCD